MRPLEWVAQESTPARTYITRVFNFGTWEEWQAMKRDFPPRQIRQAVLRPLRGQWTRRGKALAEALFDRKLPEDVLIRFDA